METIRDIVQQIGYSKTGEFLREPDVNDFEKRVDSAVFAIKKLLRKRIYEACCESKKAIAEEIEATFKKRRSYGKL